jgi:hypothetical protein
VVEVFGFLVLLLILLPLIFAFLAGIAIAVGVGGLVVLGPFVVLARKFRLTS